MYVERAGGVKSGRTVLPAAGSVDPEVAFGA